MSRLILTAGERGRLRRQLAQTRDAHVYRRTLALLEVGQGRAPTAVARMLGVTRQSIYNWIEAYRQERTPAALLDASRSGRPRLWTDETVALLQELLLASLQQFGYPAANWTVSLLQEHLARSAGQRYSEDTIRRQLERMDYAWKTAPLPLDTGSGPREKSVACAGKSGTYQRAACSWPQMRPICVSSRRSGRVGHRAGSRPMFA